MALSLDIHLLYLEYIVIVFHISKGYEELCPGCNGLECTATIVVKKRRTLFIDKGSQKAWSGLSPTRNPVHLGLWGLSFPSVESQSETLFLFLFQFTVWWFLTTCNTNCDLVNIVCVYNFKLGLWWVPGQNQSPSSLGPKVRIQTHRSPKNASWVGRKRCIWQCSKFVKIMPRPQVF